MRNQYFKAQMKNIYHSIFKLSEKRMPYTIMQQSILHVTIKYFVTDASNVACANCSAVAA